MVTATVREQMKGGEQVGVAFMTNAHDTSHVAATVCGFLNSRGGVLFLGVDERGTVLGVDQDAEELRRNLEAELQRKISPVALFTVSVDVNDDIAFITIEVPAGQDVPYVTDGKIFLRAGSRTVAATPDRVLPLIQGRSVEANRWERRPSHSLNDADLQHSEIHETAHEARSASRLIFSSADYRSILHELGLVVSSGYTNACDVLFAKTPTSRHPQCRVRFIQFQTSKVGSAFTDETWIGGPLVGVFSQIMQRLSTHVRTRAQFGDVGSGRSDEVNYSVEALREGLVNALAHRDYSAFTSGVSVSIYPNRIEIWNSGRLPKSIKVADLKSTHPSIPTNPDIAHVLYLRRLMERIGRGTQKIIAACKEIGARAPKWEDKVSGVTLTIYSAHHKASDFNPNERQLYIIRSLRAGDSVRPFEYQQTNNVSDRQASRELSELEEAEFLEKLGKGRATSYRRTEKFS